MAFLVALFPVDELEAWLIACAKAGESVTYGEAFARFGLPFRRFEVGQLCAALDAVDELQRGRGRPELACLVVRAADRIPGQGWWLSKHHDPWDGPFEGPEARRFVESHQGRAFAFWAGA
jgi:hypothetical protein